jgi:TonB family protein
MKIPDGLPSFPYPGMRPFEPSDSAIFFGQDENIEVLIENLGRARFVAVLGESGVGKSSLVKAGLIPELRRGNTSLWHIPVCKPGISPLAELASALREVGLAGGATISDILSRLRTHRASLREMIDDALLPPDERVLIVVDQFEELFRFRWPDDPRFAVHASPEHSLGEDASLFVKLLLTAATSSVPPVYVLVTMRAEFLGDCAAFYELGEAVNQGAFLLPRMKRDQYTSAINEPLRLYGYDVERSLLHELLNETMTAPEDALPLLQHALRWLWDRHARDSDRILSMNDFMPTDATMKKYSKTVPTQVILDAHLDEIYDELKRAGLEKATERLMRCLGEYDQKGRLIRRLIDWDTARAVAFAEAAKCTAEVLRQNSDQLKRIIDTFRDPNRGRSFLVCVPGPHSQLSSEESGMNHCARLELSHEVILRQWSKLGQWFNDEKKNAEQYQHLAEQANRYPRHATLLSGPAVQMAERWLAEFSPTAGWAERYSQYDARTRVFRYDLGRTVDFVRKSIRARRNEYLRNASIATLTLVLLVLGWLAWRQETKKAADRIQAEIAIQEQIKSAQQQEITRITTALNTANGDDRKRLANELSIAQNSLNDATSQARGLQSQLQAVASTDQKRIVDLQVQVDTLNEKVSQLTIQLNNAEAASKQVDTLKAENERLRASADAVRLWSLIWDSSDPCLFELYLQFFPTGTFASIAQKRVTKLRTQPQQQEPCKLSNQQTSPGQLPAATQPAVVRVSGTAQKAKLIKKVQPVYPPLARQTRISGTVRLQVLIDSDGTVASLQILSGHPLLEQAALDAVLQWQYEPTLLNGKPVSVISDIDVVFSIAY